MSIPLTALLFLTLDLKLIHLGKYSLKNISDLAQQEHIKSFSELSSKKSLPAKEFMTYARVTSILAITKIQQISIPESILAMWNPTSLPKKDIVVNYNLLKSKMHFETPKQLHKWETDLNITITQDQWLQAIK